MDQSRGFTVRYLDGRDASSKNVLPNMQSILALRGREWLGIRILAYVSMLSSSIVVNTICDGLELRLIKAYQLASAWA